MLINSLKTLFNRDLEKLKQEIGAYATERSIWQAAPGITNSGGNLCLHIIGNLSFFIGTELGQAGYVRHRDLEFSLRNVPREELLAKLDGTIAIVTSTLDQLTDDQLGEEYPLLVFEKKMTTGFFLVHLSSHLTYHLGQINYHRRLLSN